MKKPPWNGQTKKKAGSVLAVLLVLFFLIACGEAEGTQTNAPTPVSAFTPTLTHPVPTPTPTHPAPTSTPTLSLVPTQGPAVLDAPISTFFGTYGAARLGPGNPYVWFLYDDQGNPAEWVGAEARPDGTVTRVDVVNSSDTSWTYADSIGTCIAFLPASATFDKWADNDHEWFTTPRGEIQLVHENSMGDCFVGYFS